MAFLRLLRLLVAIQVFSHLAFPIDRAANLLSLLPYMKSAYELAMERLSKSSPTVKLTDDQKKQLAQLESQCAAKIAERELFLKGEIEKAIDKGDAEAMEQLEKQLVSDRKSIRASFDEKKEQVRKQTMK
jgi:hypothetical protein